jgi:hypothetical protein
LLHIKNEITFPLARIALPFSIPHEVFAPRHAGYKVPAAETSFKIQSGFAAKITPRNDYFLHLFPRRFHLIERKHNR